MARILVIDDLDRTVELCRRVMPEHDYVGPARCWREASDIMDGGHARLDLVLLDVNFDISADLLLGVPEAADEAAVDRARRRQGLEILARIRRRAPLLPVVLMTGLDDLPLEREAETLGAQEYTYFLDNEYVDASALRAQVEGILRAARGAEVDGPVFWGVSFEMRRLRQRLLTLSRGRLPIILSGPTGTGTTLVVRHFVHQRSGRKGALVTVDLSTLPRDLMAAHLFGSVRGAYTGSVSDRLGAFEAANGGTLFLDEVGNLPQEAQRMLLTVLQEGVLTRLGDTRERKVDVKLVVASNEDLGELVRGGSFRADLYMRLNPACTVSLPPLTSRLEDLESLLSFSVERALAGSYPGELLGDYLARNGMDRWQVRVVTGGGVPPTRAGTLWVLFSGQTMRQLRQHRWPGNLRELAMTVENALSFTLAELAGLPAGERGDVIQVRPKLMGDLLKAVRVDDEGPPGWRATVTVQPRPALNQVAQAVERQYFLQLYQEEDGDFGRMAAVLLGDPSHARKVQLRFNQLGLRVRDMKR